MVDFVKIELAGPCKSKFSLLLWYLSYVYRMYLTSVILSVTSICMFDMFLYAMFLNHVLTSLSSQHVFFTDRSGMT